MSDEMIMIPKEGAEGPLRVYDACVCIACSKVTPTKAGNGLQAEYCKTCHEKFSAAMKHWNEHGLYAHKGELR